MTFATGSETHLSSQAGGTLVGRSNAPAFFYPPRHVTGALLTSMGFEFIRPDQVAAKWRYIHSPKIAQS